MIGFYFVVKKNSWNILVKIAKPPDYTLTSYSSLKSWKSHTHGTRKNGPRKNGPRNGLQKYTHTTTMLDPQPTIFRFWVSRGPIFRGPFFWDQFFGDHFFGDHFSGTNFPGTIFPGTIFPGTNFPGTIFLGTNFTGTIFPGTIFPRTIFPGDHLSGVSHTHTHTHTNSNASWKWHFSTFQAILSKYSDGNISIFVMKT